MNTSVSPLPIPIWPMLVLSLALVSATTAAVTISGQRANQTFRAQERLGLETEMPEIAKRLLQKRAARNASSGMVASAAL